MNWRLLLAFNTLAWAQDPKFSTRSHEVVVPVSVMTKAQMPVENLTASDFVVMSDGKAQNARMISRDSGALPVHAAIVLQANDASDVALAKIKKTASVISSYITNDMEIGAPSLAAVVSISDSVQLLQDFTSDPNILAATFTKIKPTGDSGRVIDGVSLACDLLAAMKQVARRVIVLIGESRDVQSQTHFSNVIVKAQKDEVVIYTISYSTVAIAFTQKASDRSPPPDEPGLYDPNDKGSMNLLAIPMVLAQLAKLNVAEALAQATGGAHEKFTTFHGLEKQLTAIGNEIHNRYTLTFVPPAQQPPGYHRLSVILRNPADAHVPARAGYWSEPE